MTTRCPPPPRRLPTLHPGDLFTPGRFDVVRIFRSAGTHASSWNEFRHFGPVSSMRFDHHPRPRRHHPVRAVMYAAAGLPGTAADPLDVAVLETFGETGTITASQHTRRLVTWTPTRDLHLLDLSTTTWLARARGNTALMSGPRGVARDWARAVWNAYPTVDGMAWSSSTLPAGTSIVLFERAATALPAHPTINVSLGDQRMTPALARIASDYGLLLV